MPGPTLIIMPSFVYIDAIKTDSLDSAALDYSSLLDYAFDNAGLDRAAIDTWAFDIRLDYYYTFLDSAIENLCTW